MTQAAVPIALAENGCRVRQARLIDALVPAGYDASLLFGRANIHSFCGHWTREVFGSLLLVRIDGQTLLAAPFAPPMRPFVDQVIEYPAAPLGTLVDDPLKTAFEAVRPFLAGVRNIGTDGFACSRLQFNGTSGDISPLLTTLRRNKLPDEIDMIQRGVRACEAAYAAARRTIRPGLTEWSLYVESLAIAIESVGEPIGELGNDFQSGTPGGPPRHRPMQEQELLPLDLGVVVRGYYSDLCRTFVVGNRPTDLQIEAHRRVVAAMQHIAATVKPGVSCRTLYEDVAAMLKGHRGWDFPHHLGHGIGLSPHETPRLNPNWDDYFQIGDVFAAEPGLYGPDLFGGVRIEQDFVVTETGVRCLSKFPLDF